MSLKKEIEQAIPGLKLDGEVTVEDALAIAQKVLSVASAVKAGVVIDGKITVEDVTGVVKAAVALAPVNFWTAAFDELERKIKASKTKFDDLLLPLVSAVRSIAK